MTTLLATRHAYRTAAALLFCAAATGAFGQTTTRYESWSGAEGAAGAHASPAGGDERVQALIDELTRLVDEADRARAADPRFLRDLRALIRTYDWPWGVELLSEDFTDGRVAQTPEWRVTAGEFRTEYGLGLHSVVRAAAPPEPATEQPAQQGAQQKGQQDVAQALLGALIEQTLGQKQQGQGEQGQQQGHQTAERPADRAEVQVALPITNAFAVALEVSARERPGRIEFVVFQGDRGGPGYRLAYNPGHEPALELLRAGSRGVSVIEAHPAALGEGEVPKRIEWTRDTSGEMVVSVDGEVLIRALDRGLRDPFDGFAITNLGGDFAVREVAIAGVEPGS